ncbi:hypothetical protein BDV96DRAFT_649111 [Lophiotrema nucula]|uniref:Uncharacterized protein n=1 Tax=Lophiotrema nucula TaxID=690887 RepID=A0A6A5Z1V2_9PLEO|nr:hypothetical protein BDV96DRAFT_649111 [Lophiotrema nucula]
MPPTSLATRVRRLLVTFVALWLLFGSVAESTCAATCASVLFWIAEHYYERWAWGQVPAWAVWVDELGETVVLAYFELEEQF